MDRAGASEATVQFCQTIRCQIAQDILSCLCDRHASTTFALSDCPTHHVCSATDHIAIILVKCRWNHAVSVLTFVNRWHFHVCLFESAPLRGALWTRHSDISLNLSLQITRKQGSNMSCGLTPLLCPDCPLCLEHGRWAYLTVTRRLS
jgi:hypothetical protein